MIRRLSIIAFCTLLSTWQYVVVSLATCPDCNQTMARIAHGQINAPFSYRLLTPLIILAMGNTPQALALFHLLMFAMFFSLLWLWSARWRVNPVVSVLLATLALIVMLPTWYLSVYTVTEWNLWLIGLLFLQSSLSSVHSTAK